MKYMILTVQDYSELIAISQMRNKLLNAFYLVEDIGRNILDMPTFSLEDLDYQKQLMLKLLADVANVITSDNNLLKDASIIEPNESTILFIKSADGQLRWIGSPTNKFEDVHKHILMEKAHKLFVERIEKGEVPYPKLLVWHEQEWEVGSTDWVAYDERGFLVAGGIIFPQHETLMKELQKDQLGMSHGMPMSSVKFQKLNTEKGDYLGISEYVSDEFTVLPVNEAANKLTNWSA
jgi:hypothetical protein